MVDRRILDGVGERAARLIDRLAARRRPRLSEVIAGAAVAGALPLLELRFVDVGHDIHLLAFLVVAGGAALRIGPGSGAIVLAAGLIGCIASAIQAPNAEDLPGLVALLVLYLLAGTVFLAVLQGSIRLRRQQVPFTPMAPVAGGSLEQLTAREVGVLRLAASGMDVAEVADLLFLSPNTVKTHLSHAYQKLGARNRQDAIRAAIHCGCLDFSDVCPHRAPVIAGKATLE